MSDLTLNVAVTPTQRKSSGKLFHVPKTSSKQNYSKVQSKNKSVLQKKVVTTKKSPVGTFSLKPNHVEKSLKSQPLLENNFVNALSNKNGETNRVSNVKQSRSSKFVERPLANSNKTRKTEEMDPRKLVHNSTKHEDSNQKEETTEYSSEKKQTSVTKWQHPGDGYKPPLFRANPPIPVVEHKEVIPITESVFSSEHVDDLPIHPYSKSNLKQNIGIDKVTTVQQLSLPVLMNGQDALIRSQTGSGKTLAYSIPIVESLHNIRPKVMRCGGVMALVIVPTRELALQTYECFVKLVKPFTWVVPGYLVGGEKRKAEKARLRKGITILVGTPGRLLDHVSHTKSLLLDRVRWLVLDEADLLLDMGYERDVAKLIEALDSQQRGEPAAPNHQRFHPMDVDAPDTPALPMASTGTGGRVHRQTVLLSATLTAAVERLAGLTLRNPKLVDAAVASGDEGTRKKMTKETGAPEDLGVLTNLELVEKDLVIPESLKQWYMLTPPKLRLVALSAFIVWKCRNSNERKMLVFMATQDMVDYHTELFASILGTRAATVSKAADEDSDLEDEYGLLANKDDDKDDDGSLVDIDCVKLHGNMSQKERTEVFRNFRAAASGVLLCTDVAARGLDLPQVDWIVQYTAPATARDYVHRVGRAARAGSAGNALVILAPSEAEFVKQLEERRVCIKALTVERSLKELVKPLAREKPELLRRKGAMEEAATVLQTRFEDAVVTRRELHDMACKANLIMAESEVIEYHEVPESVKMVRENAELTVLDQEEADSKVDHRNLIRFNQLRSEKESWLPLNLAVAYQQ